jgi:hypothetical protein
VKTKSKYFGQDYGVEDCYVILKGEDNTALILTKAKNRLEKDCLIIAYWNSQKKYYEDNHLNWLNIKGKISIFTRLIKKNTKSK